MRRLAAPLRLAWDWDWPPVAHPATAPRRPDVALVRAVGAEIVRARVLLLEVGYPPADAVLSGELAAALAGFTGSLSLVVTPVAAAGLAAAGGVPASLGAAETWLDATPGPGAAAELPPWPAVRVFLTSGNVAAAAAAVVRALEAGGTAISLPNLPLFGEPLRDARSACPGPEELRAFADLVAPALLARPGIDLRIHHYGLTEELRARGLAPDAGEAPGAAGCQAGTALAYVDPNGVLYPCASLPIPLARVGDGALEAAWSDPALEELRGRIARLPAACDGCPAAATCRGGCRGWAHFLAGSWDAVGPDCVRPPGR